MKLFTNVIFLSLLLFLQTACSDGVPEFDKFNDGENKTDPTLGKVANFQDGDDEFSSINQSPLFTWDPPTGYPEEKISHYDLKLIESDGTILMDWQSIGKVHSFQFNGSPFPFDDGSSYIPLVRAVNLDGQTGPSAQDDGWSVSMAAVSNFPTNKVEDETGVVGDGVCGNGDGHCSLREAVVDAIYNVNNSGSTSETVKLGTGRFEIAPTNGVITVDKSIKIVGDGPSATVIDAAGGQPFQLEGDSSVTVTFENLAIINARNTTSGTINIPMGNPVNVVIKNVLFYNNFSAGTYGSAIHSDSDGDVTIEDSHFIKNWGTVSPVIALHDHATGVGDVVIRRSSFLHNSVISCDGGSRCKGTAFFADGPDRNITIESSSFVGNYNNYQAGAVFISTTGVVKVYNNTFVKNTTDGTSAGAIALLGGGTDTEIFHNTFVGNTARTLGAAIYNKDHVVDLRSNLFKDSLIGLSLGSLQTCGTSTGVFNSLGGNVIDGNGSSCNLSGASSDLTSSATIHVDVDVTFAESDVPYLDAFAGSSHIGIVADCSTLPASLSVDQLGRPRDSSNCDAGAIEYVAQDRPRSIFYPRSKVVAVVGKEIPKMLPIMDGAAASHFSVKPSLPIGLYLDPATGEISGTGLFESATPVRYRVTASNAAGSVSTYFMLSVETAYFVNTTADTEDLSSTDDLCRDSSGNCSLMAAVQQLRAGNDLGIRTIYLPAGTYNLSRDIGNLPHPVQIVGQGMATSIVDLAGVPTEAFKLGQSINDWSYFFSDLKFQNSAVGVLSTNGDAFLRVSHVHFEANTSSTGAAILVSDFGAYADVEFSIFNQNRATGTTTGHGGAIRVAEQTSRLVVRHSTFEDNQAYSTKKGGAIYSNQFEIYNSLFSGNSARHGGAIASSSNFESKIIGNSFVGNVADANGAALYLSTSKNVLVLHNTFSKNELKASSSEGTLHKASNDGHVYLGNNIFSGNFGTSGSQLNCSGNAVSSQGGNVFDNPTGCNSSGDLASSASTLANSGDPVNHPVAGFPQYLAIGSGSEAVDAARSINCTRLNILGKVRLQSGLDYCDSGAHQSD